jgi:hypothetical protein
MWKKLPALKNKLQKFTVANNADGRLEVFGLTADGKIIHTWQKFANGSWVGRWFDDLSVDEEKFSDFRVAKNRDGRLEIFGTSLAKQILHTWQTAPGGNWADRWFEFSSSRKNLKLLDVARNADGRLEVFGLAPNNWMFHRWQVSPDGKWTRSWTKLPPPPDQLGNLQVTNNQDGRLEAFGSVLHTWQPAPKRPEIVTFREKRKGRRR